MPWKLDAQKGVYIYVKCELRAEDCLPQLAKNHVKVISRESGGPFVGGRGVGGGPFEGGRGVGGGPLREGGG